MPIAPEEIVNSKRHQLSNWLDRRLLEEAERRQATDPPVFRIKLPDGVLGVGDEIVDGYFAVGWPFVRVRSGEGCQMILAGRLATAFESFRFFWQLELECHARPSAVDFHTMHCKIKPSELPQLATAALAYFVPHVGPGRSLSDMRCDREYPDGRYRYRIDFQRG